MRPFLRSRRAEGRRCAGWRSMWTGSRRARPRILQGCGYTRLAGLRFSRIAEAEQMMSNAAHAYTPPDTPARRCCPRKSRAISMGTTCSPKRRPCASRRSMPKAGHMPRSSAPAICWRCRRDEFALVVFPQSTTTANLMRDGRVTVTLSLDGGMCELRMKCRRLAHASSDVPLAFFEAELVEVRTHKAPYAAVSGGVTFAFMSRSRCCSGGKSRSSR